MPASRSSSKYFLRESSLIRLYTVLFISFSYFLLQITIAHLTHALVLQVDAYHMLVNVFALVTSIMTTKMSRKGSSLKNTFGWTRIDVCGAVAGLCFLAATCFSLVIESLQAMFHSTHHEKMTQPILVLIVGVVGVFVNLTSFMIIGGYTKQQRGFLGSHRDGQDIMISPSARRGPARPKLKFGGPMDMLRDFFGCFLVVFVSIVLYFWDDHNADNKPHSKISNEDFVDPIIAIFEVVILGFLSYRYGKEAGYILLLTIPDNMNVESLMDDLFNSFPEITDVHEFHLWQLNPSRIIATMHVVLRNTENCWTIQNNIIEFLEGKGIAHVTLQPEFEEVQPALGGSPNTTKRRKSCFLPCRYSEDCHEKKCCPSDTEVQSSHGHGHSHSPGHGHGHSHEVKIPGCLTFKNPFRSKSLNNVENKRGGNALGLQSLAHGHVHSSPELAVAAEKKVTLKDSPVVQHTSESNDPDPGKSSLDSNREDTQHDLDDVQSSEDEDAAVRKPMI